MMLAAKQGNRLQRETGRYQACACACRPHRRGAPQQATCAKGVDARQGRWRGQAGGLRQNTTSGGGSGETGGRWSAARTDRPTRGDADEEGGVGHGGAGAGESRHQEAAGGREREKRRPGDSSPAPLRLRSDLREASLADEVGEDLRQAPEPRQHAPPFPAAPASRLGSSARRRAEASESCPVAPTDQVS